VFVISILLCSELILAPIAAAADHLGSPGANRASASSTCDSAGIPTTTVYLPNITKTLGGALGWDTPFYIQDAGAVQATIEVSFFRFSDGVLVACRKTVAVAPGTSLLDDPNADADLPNDTQFSVVVKSFGALVVASVNQVQGTGGTTEGLSYSGFSAGATKVYLPNVTRRFFGYDVPFIIQNLGSVATIANAAFVSFDGTKTFQTSLSVAPGRSGVVDPDFTPGLIDGTQYAVIVTATQPVAVVVNAHNEAIGPVAFSHNGLAAGGTTLYAPYAAKIQGGMFSPVVVQNVGLTTADATLTFAPLLAGGAAQTFTLTAIPAGSSRAFDPRFTLGTTTPCTVAGPTCLGSGEYSLKIQATAPVAAVVLPNSPTTAAGYVAASDLQTRSLLPIVMRTVGGTSGWTTLIYVQSGTATQATVRFYALGTGALVTTQSLALAATATRLDPRAVPALQDNAQYAVTIDGNGGTLTTIAHEQAGVGGDASMVYEAFGLPSLSATPQPGSMTNQPGGTTVASTFSQQFTAAVKDQFGVAMTGQPVLWSVSPAALGTISATGLFTAGPTSGGGFVTASVLGLTAAVTVTVQSSSSTTIGGISFLLTPTASADLYTETTISSVDVQRLAAELSADVAQIQSDYLQPYAVRPVAYVLASSTTFAQAVQTIGGATSPPPSWFAGECCFGPNRSWVFIDWPVVSVDAQLTAIRHELTHMMERQLAPQASLPAWFNEGNARLEELTINGTLWYAMFERYMAASMTAQGSLFSLADLTSQATWNARAEPQATYQYAVATEAVQLLRNDVGLGGELSVFRSIAQGQTFEAAYATVATHPFSDFSSAYAARIRGLAQVYPGIATAGDTYAGPGVSFVIYGLPASAPFTLAVTGDNGYSLSGSGSRNADAYGVSRGALSTSNGWPAGTYTISATWSGGVVSTSVAKTSSFAVATTSSLSATLGIALEQGAEMIGGPR
jgi:hypothetical protein